MKVDSDGWPNLNQPGGDVKERREVVRLLGIQRDPQNLPSLVKRLQDPNSNVRGMACRALGWLKQAQVIPHLLSMTEDQEPSVRQAAIASLALCPEPMCDEALVKLMLKDTDAYVRADACRVSGWLGLAATSQACLKVLELDDADVARAQAARALGRLGYAAATSALIDALRSKHVPLRTHAALALCELGDTDASLKIEARADDSDAEMRAVVVRITTTMKTPRCQGVAIAALEDPNPGVRATAAVALMRLNIHENIGVLKTKLDDPHPEVRARVREAIESIKTSRTAT